MGARGQRAERADKIKYGTDGYERSVQRGKKEQGMGGEDGGVGALEMENGREGGWRGNCKIQC